MKKTRRNCSKLKNVNFEEQVIKFFLGIIIFRVTMYSIGEDKIYFYIHNACAGILAENIILIIFRWFLG